jgi:tRNA-2-methylthio-N6-dimethylallyladenosine synthase
MEVLFEKPGRQSGQAIGRSPYLTAVHVDNAAHLIGQIARIRVESVHPNSFKGSLQRETVHTH